MQINNCILIFNTTTFLKKLRIGYFSENVEWSPNWLWCYNCEKLGYHEDVCKRWPACKKKKCGLKGPDHLDDGCGRDVKHENCGGSTQQMPKKSNLQEGKIKCKQNIPFP